MIGRLTGKLLELDGGSVLVDVAGVAYEVEVSAGVLQTLPRVGEEMRLHTHFVVREDAQLLYGFASKSERELFRAFIKISGVGPKLGLALISALDPQSLSAAVRNNDVSMLTKVLNQIRDSGVNNDLNLLGVIMTMFDGRTRLSRQVVDATEHVLGRALTSEDQERFVAEALAQAGSDS